MRVGIVLNGRRTADEIADLARLAEECGIDRLWLSGGSRTKDHFLRLAVAATRTTRIQLGPVAVSPFEAHPARIAIELLTLHEIAGGRAAVVLGGGGDFAATLGVGFEGRVDAVEDTIDVTRAMARGGEVNHQGRRFRVGGLFSPWSGIVAPPLHVGANRPRMIGMAARKADGVMFTDMPLAHVPALVARVRGALAAAGRSAADFAIGNWFVWNVQDTREHALALARRQLGFRLYYIRDVAAAIGLPEAEARELEGRQREMLRAIFAGGQPWAPPDGVADRLIRHLTLSGGPEDLDGCVERLLAFERAGLTEIALAPHGDAARAIRLLGERVLPLVQKPGARDEAGRPPSRGGRDVE
jgi:alkanesulfonate monooxygenase SsuD/methylene tetrahydromethanopterin reductase-like flavin-dependent oxidoreductase (luciferase family)